MITIGLFYGSTTCYTEMVAEKIQQLLGEEIVTLHNIKDIPISQCLNFDYLIFGISTWDYGELQEDWESHWQDVAALDLSGKTIALYGMGDQVGYGDWYQDALGMLHAIIQHDGVNIIGYTSSAGHEFSASKALTADGSQFVGLALDDENQYQLTDERLAAWCEQILVEITQSLEN